MKRYRIAIVTRTFPPRGGGIAAAHYNLFRLLAPHHDVKAFAFDDDRVEPDGSVVRRKSSGTASRFLVKAMERYVARRDHRVRSVYATGIASVFLASRALSRPMRDFDPEIVIVPDHYVPALGMKFPKGASVVWVSHHNYGRFANQPLLQQRSWMDLHVAQRLELRGLRKAQHVVCPSRYMERLFRETFQIDIPVDVIPNTIDEKLVDGIARVDLKSELGLSRDQKLIYIPSAGSAVKGKRYVFEVLRRLGKHGDVGFFLSGHIDKDLAREIASLGADFRISAPGPLPYEDNLARVAACDFGLSPTLIENFSSAILEGLMLGLPFVTFDTGGNKEIITSGINGYIVPYLDVESLIANASNLLGNPELLEGMRQRSRASAESLIDPAKILAQYDALFSRLRVHTAGP